MRQGQQNRRGRGRNNNQNRKSQNPLARSFESTGPDVKVRGTPSHIAEKYISLARDALSSGDPVLAENYLQHAEHYNRIILTYREQQMSQGGEFNPNLPRPQTLHGQDSFDDDANDDEAAYGDDSGQSVPMQGTGEQPNFPQQRSFDGGQRFDNRQQRHNNNRHDNNRFDRGERLDRGDQRFNRQDRQDRGQQAFAGEEGVDNVNGSSGHRRRDRYQGGGHGERHGDRQTERAERQQPAADAQPSIGAADVENEQPAFLRRPVRRPRRDNAESGQEVATPRQAVADEQE